MVKGPKSNANSVGENNSFIFTCYAKTILFYHFVLVYVVLHMTVKELSIIHVIYYYFSLAALQSSASADHPVPPMATYSN